MPKIKIKIKDPAAPHIVKVFGEAINILDQSEPKIRDLIESRLMDVAGINRMKVSDAVLAGKSVSDEITALRHKHIVAAFRHLRDNLPSDI